MNTTVFEAINITKKYRNTLALNQVSMSVMQGDIYGFIGENGAGKTTMIRLLTGLAEPTTGNIALFGKSDKKLAKQRERIGCIIESPSLYRKMRLRDESGIPFPEYIFTKDDGTPIHPDTFSKHLKALFAEIGLPKTYHLHTLRHFFVSTLLHEGVDKNTVADLAGHGDTSFLERTYCHPQMQLKQEAAKRMSNSLFAAPNPELLVS